MIHKLTFVLFLVVVLQSHLGFAAYDGLVEVNQRRAARGLRPFLRDEQLSRAAAAAADFRAARLMAGHTSSDFAFLPSGASASSAGCAAWPQGMGWGSCCSEDNWRYAGAAYAIGRDGQRYMHLFVSNSPNAKPVPVYRWERAKAGWWYRKGSSYIGFLHENRTFQWRLEDGTYSEGQQLEAGQALKRNSGSA